MSANPVDANAEVMEMQLRREGGIAILTINNVARRNAWSEPVKQDCLRHLKSLLSDNTAQILDAQGEVELDDHGNPIALVGICQNVTRKQREEEIQKQAKKIKKEILTDIKKSRHK